MGKGNKSAIAESATQNDKTYDDWLKEANSYADHHDYKNAALAYEQAAIITGDPLWWENAAGYYEKARMPSKEIKAKAEADQAYTASIHTAILRQNNPNGSLGADQNQMDFPFLETHFSPASEPDHTP